jgi:ABC-type uncharacterized transport system substrate-binding protein
MRTSQKTPETITTIGIDLGKNTFHLVGLDDHPGRNITGMSSIVTDLEAKRLEILKEIVPGIKRVAILGDFRNSAVVMQWDEVQTAARSLALEVEPFDVRNSEDSGLVASFPHPGGNVTGFMVMEPTMAGKWLELLKEIAPRVARVALLFNPATATYAEYYPKPFKAASASLAVEAIALPVRDT